MGVTNGLRAARLLPISSREGLAVISHDNGIVFIHIRKAAGTSILRAFNCPKPWDSFMQDGLLDKNWPEFAQGRGRYTVFTVVRNPWDRFVSAWKYLERTRDRPIEDVLASLPTIEGGARERHDYRHITRLQTDLFIPPDGDPIADGVLRFENLQEDFDAFCDKVDIPRRTLGHHTKNPARESADYRPHFESRIVHQMFLDHFARDVELLGYSF